MLSVQGLVQGLTHLNVVNIIRGKAELGLGVVQSAFKTRSAAPLSPKENPFLETTKGLIQLTTK